MRRSFLVAFLLAGAACIDIPDNVQAQFARPTVEDRSNYRKGPHGSALPLEEVEAPASKSAGDGGASPADSGTDDGGATSPAVQTNDGGAQ